MEMPCHKLFSEVFPSFKHVIR